MERNVTLDFIRGVAILGILLLNISAFGLPKAAYLNPARYGDITLSDADTGAARSLCAGKIPHAVCAAVRCRSANAAPRGKRWIQSRLTLLVLLGFIHGLLFWDGDILLAYGDRPDLLAADPGCAVGKSLFNTGVLLYLVGVGVLLLLGVISGSETSRARTPDASALLYEKYWKVNGGMEAISNRVDMMSNSLLALGAQYGWQLAGMMLLGAALMRSGWLKGQYSLQHYRRTGVLLVIVGMAINLPAIIAQWNLDWAYRWCAFLLQAPRELGAPMQTIGYAALMYGFWPQLSRLKWVIAVACVGRMALTNYLLQTLICTTLFYQFGFIYEIRPTGAAVFRHPGLGH